MINTKMGVFLLAAFIAGAFIASPELRAYAAATITSADIVNETIKSEDIKNGEVKTNDLAGNSVTAAKIKDGEVTAVEIATDAVGAAEIATNAVGASELAGVDKLMFADCVISSSPIIIGFGDPITSECPVAGLDIDDNVIVPDNAYDCFSAEHARIIYDGTVQIIFKNICAHASTFKANHVSIIVFDELPDKVPPG
jgi:hypothetical protein